MANGLLMLTRCTGFSYSVAEPMSKEPAGTTTSSPQFEQSRNTSPGLKLPDAGSVAGAVEETCGAGLAGGAGAGAGVAAGAGDGAGAGEGAAATGRELPK